MNMIEAVKKFNKLEVAHSNAKCAFLVAARDVALARITACDTKAIRYDGSKADINIDTALRNYDIAHTNMLRTAKALDVVISYKEDDDGR